MRQIDWAALERLALAELRILPREFWALTPREFQLMVGTESTSRPLTSSGLIALERDVQKRFEKRKSE